MARRKDHTREELKEMCIASAHKIVGEEGLEGLSTRKIAKDIGYTVGTLYNVFENFDDLILHVNFVTLEAMHDFVAAGLPTDIKGADGVKALARLYIDFAKDNQNHWAALVGHDYAPDSVLNESLPAWYSEKTEALFSLIEGYIAAEHSAMDQKRVYMTARTIWAGVHGIVHLGLHKKLGIVGAENDMREYITPMVDDLITSYLGGLGN